MRAGIILDTATRQVRRIVLTRWTWELRWVHCGKGEKVIVVDPALIMDGRVPDFARVAAIVGRT